MSRSAVETLKSGDLGKPGFFKAYSFGIVTAVLFLGSWLGQFFTQLMVVQNESEQHGQPFQWSEFFPQFFASTFETKASRELNESL